MQRKLSGNAMLEVVVDHSDRAADRRDVAKSTKNGRGLIKQFRRLIFGENLILNKFSYQGDENDGIGISKFGSSATSKHKIPPKFGVVYCDESGQLYRIDRLTDEFIPIVSSSSA
jgi:hypothetical protein